MEKVLPTFAVVASLLLSSGEALAEVSCQGKEVSSTASTPSRDFEINGDGTVTHRKTGLMWQQCLVGARWSAARQRCLGYESQAGWRAMTLAASFSGFAGYNDWRIPTAEELMTIAEAKCRNPILNREIFHVQSSRVRLLSSMQANFNDVIYLSLDNGQLKEVDLVSNAHAIMVRDADGE